MSATDGGPLVGMCDTVAALLAAGVRNPMVAVGPEEAAALLAAVRADVEAARLREIVVDLLAVSRDALDALQDADHDDYDGGVLTGRLQKAIADGERWKVGA